MSLFRNKKIIVKETHKYGKGAFANEDIRKGEIIHVMSGRRLDLKDLVDRLVSKKEYIDDPLQIGKRTYLDLDGASRTFNHSCQPNMGMRKKGELFTLRNIRKGEELTYDYSATIAPTEWSMKCKCGTEKCRKVLGDVLSIPKGQLNEYRESGALQAYMRRLLRKMDHDHGYTMPRYEVLALEKLNLAGVNH